MVHEGKILKNNVFWFIKLNLFPHQPFALWQGK